MVLSGVGFLSAQDGNVNDYIFENSKSLSELWELDEAHQSGTFLISSYKPIYFTIAKYSSDTNKNPISERSEAMLPEPIGLNTLESKFQISLKTKIFHNVFWGKGDLWAAYTQRAHWQIYNDALSRPFRELNYEPEIIVNFPVRYSFLGWTGRMLGAAFVHESNGRSEPLSRSWNRMVFHAGFENGDWQVMLRPWFRIPAGKDDNEDIMDFIGRGEASVIYDLGGQRFRATVRHSLRFGDKSKGSVQLDWSFPIVKNFSGHIQFFDGYGETLIDYNHRQTTIGIGVSLIN
ncbi:phospholipase A [Aggregatimonas sangjinii]|uniref:Phosphatidylcholine 1-acylhydrolase n=2 Tax=Aggregatimonas sangjinii TaxID=2583587 RepID=A0A5B7T015_9FLAO|nr:phospholipase A [Aggregatimonas sangjinii]